LFVFLEYQYIDYPLPDTTKQRKHEFLDGGGDGYWFS